MLDLNYILTIFIQYTSLKIKEIFSRTFLFFILYLQINLILVLLFKLDLDIIIGYLIICPIIYGFYIKKKLSLNQYLKDFLLYFFSDKNIKYYFYSQNNLIQYLSKNYIIQKSEKFLTHSDKGIRKFAAQNLNSKKLKLYPIKKEIGDYLSQNLLEFLYNDFNKSLYRIYFRFLIFIGLLTLFIILANYLENSIFIAVSVFLYIFNFDLIKNHIKFNDINFLFRKFILKNLDGNEEKLLHYPEPNINSIVFREISNNPKKYYKHSSELVRAIVTTELEI